MPRNPLQTTIQIARRQLGLEEDDYRALLERITGKRSTKGMSARDMHAVLAEFKRQGFDPSRGRHRHKAEERRDLRYIFVLWRLLAEQGRVHRGRAALNSFACGAKFHQKYSSAPTDVRFLTGERARDVIEALKDMCRRNGISTQQ